MRDLREIRGLKYPDEFVVRHFFKRGLSNRTGRVLELGSGTGNNLSLYRHWGWACVGVDYDAAAIADARFNLGEEPQFIQADLSHGLPPLDGPFDVLIIPNLLCYLTIAQARAVLNGLRPLLAAGCEVFVRTRLTDDYRYGKGVEEEADGFRLATPETGEAGLFNLFYTPPALTGLLAETLGLGAPTVLTCRFDNIQAGRAVTNSDIIVWGSAGGGA
jgi:SAM-dependent methyltransferase